jgi:hypothetical protein
MLHLTNGSAIIGRIRDAGVQGAIVPWDDVLHEGPVPAGLGPAALRERRADFLASAGWVSRDVALRGLASRDEALDAAIARREEIVLWFEHDLYDQLQLIQILDRVPVDGLPRVTLVQPATYIDHEPAARYPDLYATRRAVSSAERLAARDGWEAFRSPDPRAILNALPRVAALMHLGPALRRHLQQFPSVVNGLSRTEQQTVEALASGPVSLKEVSARTSLEREEAFFFGDSGFLFHISSLIRSSRPLISASARQNSNASFGETASDMLDVTVELSEDGERVLKGEIDRVASCGIDRWLGGVYLAGTGPVWRWDNQNGQLRFV